MNIQKNISINTYANVPVLALRDQVILPNVVTSVQVGREISINAVMSAIKKDVNQIVLVAQKNMDVEKPCQGDLYDVGTLCNILQFVELVGGAYKIYIEGIQRVRIKEITEHKHMLSCNAESIETIITDELQSSAHIKTISSSFTEYVQLKGYAEDISSHINKITDKEKIANLIANNLQINTAAKQEFLSEQDFIKQLEILLSKIDYEKAILKIEEQLKTKSSEAQKERLLEQINAIQSKLLGGYSPEAEEIKRKKHEKGQLPPDIESEFWKVFESFARMSKHSPDFELSRTYLSNLLDIPTQYASINYNPNDVLKVLDEKISGQEKIKDKIIQQIAVMGRNIRLSKDKKPSKPRIMCFSGPPGLGKTSMAQAIAQALRDMNAKNMPELRMATIALGSLRDEAELKGHRRTYVGAMPGQIIKAFINSKILNPIILLDEIDKVMIDHQRGDVQGALIAMLDPTQNHAFIDNYINAPFDISNALFIATANDISRIHPALRDRLQIIELPPYTEREKIAIAKKMLQDIRKETMLENNLSISDNAIKKIISSYTYEAGVRDLKRCITDIAFKIVKNLEDVRSSKRNDATEELIKVTVSNLIKYLGEQKVSQKRAKHGTPGVINGLAWSIMGGGVIVVESSIFKGKGELRVTGLAEKSMMESAQIALTCIKKIASQQELKDFQGNSVDSNFFSSHDIHIHMNEGAVKKDGPSAGVTIFSAVLSAITGIIPRANVAMTGEITLTGGTTSIGGLEQKLIAAHKTKCCYVCVPIDNILDIDAMPQEIIHPTTKNLVRKISNLHTKFDDNDDSTEFQDSRANIIREYIENTFMLKKSYTNDDKLEDLLNKKENKSDGLIIIPCATVYDVANIILPGVIQ